ncbi:hypothetical protein RJT34_12927 [Clitoria ternatea]|uniref:BTB domain-containing protein n=1 Tax=Clitoria ternatea TaxID=43366 RepID=A0AAN9JN43_CLITE
MPPRRYPVFRELDDNMKCLACEEEYDPENLGTCKECYEKEKEELKRKTKELVEMKSKNEELESKASFLSICSPVLNPSPFFSTEPLLLVPVDDSSASPIPAHKNILVTRSPVFKAMLESDMLESRSGKIKIADVSCEVLRAFVNFLYTAEACLNDKMAGSLLALGEKYQVKHLKAYCEKFLISKLNWDKSLKFFTFASKYNCKQLKGASMEVIMNNMPNFTENYYHEVMARNNYMLIVEIYEKYARKLINNPEINDPNFIRF